MRLLIFLDTDHLSGPARLALDFSVEAQRLGHEVLMLGLSRGAQSRPSVFCQTMEAAGVPTQTLHERFRFDPGVLRQFGEVLARFKPDLYQSNGYKGSLLGWLARRRAVAWQAIFHGFTWENWRVRLYHALDLYLMRRAGEVIAVSRPFQRLLGQKGIDPRRLRWVPNAISEANLRATGSGRPLRQEWMGPSSEGLILAGTIGRFSPEKAPDHFLRAFARASASQPALRGVMIGDGPLLDESKAMAGRLGLEGRVLFPGFRSDLASIYEALDMLVIPSRSEGMPTVLLEAMLMGVPVISTRVGAVPDVVLDGETALLTPVDDEAALSDAILRLSASPDMRHRIGESGRLLARNRLSVDQRARTLLNHAHCLLAKKPLPADDWDAAPEMSS